MCLTLVFGLKTMRFLYPEEPTYKRTTTSPFSFSLQAASDAGVEVEVVELGKIG